MRMRRQVRSVMDTLIDVLRTPSSDVQRSVADCLGPLMAGLAGDRAYVESVVSRVLAMLTKGASYGDRCAQLRLWPRPTATLVAA